MSRSSSCPAEVSSDGTKFDASLAVHKRMPSMKRSRSLAGGRQACSPVPIGRIRSLDARTPKVADARRKTRVGCLDEGAFRNFAPLLAACQGYAKQSGCRFLGNDFRAADLGAGVPWQGAESRAPAVACAERANALASTISETVLANARRLQAGERSLCEEVERAFYLVMVESVRNAMIAAFRKLEMWPPVLKPRGVEDDDCSYEDVSSSLPVIAQRAYNDDLRRRNELIGIGGLCRIRHRAMTASFLVDFAQDAGVALPAMPETHVMMLREFACRVAEWEFKAAPQAQVRQARDAYMCGFGTGVVADRLRSESDGWWRTSPASLLATGLMLMFPVITVGFALAAAPVHRNSIVTAPRLRLRTSLAA